MKQNTYTTEKKTTNNKQLEDVIVTDVRTADKHGYTALQLGSTIKKEKNVSKPLVDHFKKLGVGLRQKLVEFRVTEDAVLPVGTSLSASHFVTGQYVDISAPSYVVVVITLKD